MELIIYLIIFIGVVTAGLVKYAQKRELSAKLGREAADHELVSLNSWLEAERRSDAKKGGLIPGKASAKDASPIFETRAETKEETSVAELTSSPDNCTKCGAALSKEIAKCQFCGTHTSREALEKHAAIFLRDLERGFKAVIPAYHDSLRLGCFLIPLLATAFAVLAYIYTPAWGRNYVVLFGAPLLSLVIAYIWMIAIDAYLNKREGILFKQTAQPKILDFIEENNLQPLEIVSIAQRHFLKDNNFLAHIFRHF